ncbi:SGNH/GDSL hydrolase family protein [Thermophilibacter sp.]
MGDELTRPAAELLRGALDVAPAGDGLARPSRFTVAQLRALGSVAAWHPGLYRQMAACSAGVCVAFRTDGRAARVELAPDEPPRATRAMLADAQRHTGEPVGDVTRASAVVDGRRTGPLAAVGDGEKGGEKGGAGEKGAPAAGAPAAPDARPYVELVLEDPASLPAPGMAHLPGLGPEHEVRLYLPCLAGCAVGDVTVEGATYLEPLGPRPVLLVLGDSVAQGFTVADPALTWPALLAERLGLDLVNQGVGGQVFQPGSLPDPAAVGPVAAVVVEFADNYRFEPCAASAVRRDARAYLAGVAARWPEAPTLVVTTPPHTEAYYPTHPRSCASEVDALIAEAAARWPWMRVVDGAGLLPANKLDELLADGSDHPGVEGSRLIARALAGAFDALP